MVDRRALRSVDNAGLAAALSLFVPGLGQAYTRRLGRGVVALAMPLGIAALVLELLLLLDPLMALALRVAVVLAAVATIVLFSYHGAVVLDAFGAPSTRGRGLAGKRAGEYALLLATLVALAGLYATVYRQSMTWAGLAEKVFEPFGRGGGQVAEAWSGSDRLNVLLLGIDTRLADGGETQNTDTLIVLTIDPVNKAAGMLSIPRDTLVTIPGHGDQKINAAFALGGPDLARRTVSQLLDVPIHGYALVDFQGFRRIVDEVGGIVVDAPLPVRDEAYPTEDFGVTRLDIRAGPQRMDGETALRYARSRHDSSDFSRAERQQRVLSALRDGVAGSGSPLELSALAGQLSDTVRTDLNPGNLLPLARLGLGIEPAKIERRVLKPEEDGTGPLRELNSASGYYLVPDPQRLAAAVAEFFYDLRVRAEAARVEVRAPSARASTARSLGDDLERRHYTVVDVSTSATQARTTVVLSNSSKRYTADQLAHALGATVTDGPGGANADIVVLLGDDFRGLAAR